MDGSGRLCAARAPAVRAVPRHPATCRPRTATTPGDPRPRAGRAPTAARDRREAPPTGYRGAPRAARPPAPSGPTDASHQRERFPRTNQPATERQAIFVLLNVISFEESYLKKNGRYGTFKEVLPAGAAMPHPERVLQRHGYRFRAAGRASESFQVAATPLGAKRACSRSWPTTAAINVRVRDE
mgnify:CR=1 FL=1